MMLTACRTDILSVYSAEDLVLSGSGRTGMSVLQAVGYPSVKNVKCWNHDRQTPATHRLSRPRRAQSTAGGHVPASLNRGVAQGVCGPGSISGRLRQPLSTRAGTVLSLRGSSLLSACQARSCPRRVDPVCGAESAPDPPLRRSHPCVPVRAKKTGAQPRSLERPGGCVSRSGFSDAGQSGAPQRTRDARQSMDVPRGTSCRSSAAHSAGVAGRRHDRAPRCRFCASGRRCAWT